MSGKTEGSTNMAGKQQVKVRVRCPSWLYYEEVSAAEVTIDMCNKRLTVAVDCRKCEHYEACPDAGAKARIWYRLVPEKFRPEPWHRQLLRAMFGRR